MALIDKETIRAEIEFAKSVYSNPKRVVHGVADAFRQDGRVAMCDDILKKLDTLPEQPVIKKSNALFDKCVENCDPAVMKEVSDNVDKMLRIQPVEGLEEEISRTYHDGSVADTDDMDHNDYENIARHFAEWGANHFRDVTKMVSEGLEEAAEEYRRESYRKRVLPNIDGPMPEYGGSIKDAFKAGAEWQKKQDQKTIELAEDHAMLAGMNKMEQQMLEGAVEGEICGRVYDHINVRFADGICKYLEPKNISHIPADVSKFKVGDKVRVIVIKEN